MESSNWCLTVYDPSGPRPCPTFRSTYQSAGVDIGACVTINCGKDRVHLVPTNLKIIGLDKNQAAMIFPKSSGVDEFDILTGVIDADYDGAISIRIRAYKDVTIKAGIPIAQIVVLKYDNPYFGRLKRGKRGLGQATANVLANGTQ